MGARNLASSSLPEGKKRGPGRPPKPRPRVLEVEVGTLPDEGKTLLFSRGAVQALSGQAKNTVIGAEGTTLTHRITGQDGAVRYDLREVRRFLTRPIRGEFDGELASQVFDLLAAGVSLRDIVRQAQIDPRAVRTLADSWAELEGGVFLSGRHLAALEQIGCLEEYWPIDSADKLITALRHAAPSRCASCADTPRICLACAEKATLTKARQRSERAAEEQRSRAEAREKRSLDRRTGERNQREEEDPTP